MGVKTKIQWTRSSWNPIAGCQKISPGCERCYAARFASRFSKVPGHKFEGLAEKGNWTGKIFISKKDFFQPYHWHKPRHIFVCSMGDLFHPTIPDEVIRSVWTVMYDNNQHIFQVLTKRPERMMEFVQKHYFKPLSNVWLGVTAENQEMVKQRVPALLETPATIRFVSLEPLLGLIVVWPYLRCRRALDWVIVGGETGPGARPMQEEWAHSLQDQCRAASIPFFFKSWGGREKNRLLDGREWNEMPG